MSRSARPPDPSLTLGMTSDNGSLRAWEIAALAAIIMLFVLLRLPLLRSPGLLLGWNSDAAIFGLMAKAIYERRDLPIFFWGQSYMGPLTSYLAAAIGAVIGGAGPLALRLAASAEVLAGIVFYWLALRESFGRAAALVVAFWLAAGPEFLFRFTFAPIGAEQVFFVGSLIFWFGVRTALRRLRDWFVVGLLAAFGWWMNQGVVFATAAVLIVAVLGPAVWSRLRDAMRLRDRLFLRGGELGWRPLDRVAKVAIAAMGSILLALLILGFLRAASFDVPALFLFDPLGEPLAILTLFHVALELALGSRLRAALRSFAAAWSAWILLLAGAVVGYLPVIIGGLLHRYPSSYGLSVPILSVDAIPRRVVETMRADVWPLIGADATLLGITLGVIVVALLIMSALRRRQPERVHAIAGLTIALCTIFYFGSWRAHPGSMRYIVSALPMIYAFAAEELVRLQRGIAAVLTAVVAIALVVPRVEQARSIAAAREEWYAGFPGDFDPRPTIRAADAAGYRVCYADYWIAYKLEWVSEGRIRFIPYHGYDRRPAESRALAALPGPKCFVDRYGSVHPFVPADDSVSRKAGERLRATK